MCLIRFYNSATCNYCREEGRWKAECPLLQAKDVRTNVRPAAFAVPVNDCCVAEEHLSHSHWAAYVPFVQGGFVPLLGSEGKVLTVFLVRGSD